MGYMFQNNATGFIFGIVLKAIVPGVIGVRPGKNCQNYSDLHV